MIINGTVISKKLHEWIQMRVATVNEPNTYIIRAHTTSRLSAHGVAENTFNELSAWVQRNHGEIELVEDAYPKAEKVRDGYLKIRIYSPVCESIVDKIIEERERQY